MSSIFFFFCGKGPDFGTFVGNRLHFSAFLLESPASMRRTKCRSFRFLTSPSAFRCDMIPVAECAPGIPPPIRGILISGCRRTLLILPVFPFRYHDNLFSYNYNRYLSRVDDLQKYCVSIGNISYPVCVQSIVTRTGAPASGSHRGGNNEKGDTQP